MGTEDRDWYRDAKRKHLERDLSDVHYNPKTFRRPRGPDPADIGSGSGSGIWFRVIVNLLALYGAVHLLRWVFHRFS